MSGEVNLETIVSLCKRRGFIYQGSEVYGGLAGTWDYGPLGTRLKRNIQNEWLKMFVDGWEDMYQVDAAILMNQKVWQASGHATGFNDPMVECQHCRARLRQDHVKDNKCPVCGTADKFSEPRQFNMMFKTQIGPTAGEIAYTPHKDIKAGVRIILNDSDLAWEGTGTSYLRPETAQGIFTNYKNILDSFYPDLPFGIAQIGKAFRNEISPRDFVFRSREFEQMEVEYFVQPDKWEDAFEHWRKDIHIFLEEKLGLPADKIHELEVPDNDRAHYSKRTIDFEFDFPIGREELLGLAYRTDFDLQNIQKASGKSMEYRPKEGGEAFVPHVIEPSFGVERAVMAVLSAAYTEDEVGGEKRSYLKLPPHLAPVQVAVSPLLKNKPELAAKAREVYEMLKAEFGAAVIYDDNGNIGKRYRRQDEIGTPHCVTIDFDTLTDDTVTVRNRDTTEQGRVNMNNLTDSLRS